MSAGLMNVEDGMSGITLVDTPTASWLEDQAKASRVSILITGSTDANSEMRSGH
jgi:hypothetical protein